jgi:type I restriction enzyme, S subunit
MSWQTYRLGDVITLKRGHDLPESQRQGGEVPIVSSSGITRYHNEPKAKAPGVVTGRYGTLGEVFYIEQDYWPLNTALYVTDFKGNHPRFVAYFLQNVLRNYQSDKAAVPGVNWNDLHDMKVRSTDPQSQERIASVLSAYDDLIENNRRRMGLLEETTRQLYQEWFVRLRFPGHEHTHITHGVPEGWELKPIGEAVTLNYGKALKEENRLEGATPVYGSSGVVGSHSAALVSGSGIVVGRKGNVGSVFWSDTPFWPIDTVYFVSPEESSLFLYHCLRQVPFQSSDVAVPGLNRTYAHSLKILMPSRRLQAEFEEAITPMFEQLTRLRTMNQKLHAARDLLLPRLMSGEIAV